MKDEFDIHSTEENFFNEKNDHDNFVPENGEFPGFCSQNNIFNYKLKQITNWSFRDTDVRF